MDTLARGVVKMSLLSVSAIVTGETWVANGRRGRRGTTTAEWL